MKNYTIVSIYDSDNSILIVFLFILKEIIQFKNKDYTLIKLITRNLGKLYNKILKSTYEKVQLQKQLKRFLKIKL